MQWPISNFGFTHTVNVQVNANKMMLNSSKNINTMERIVNSEREWIKRKQTTVFVWKVFFGTTYWKL